MSDIIPRYPKTAAATSFELFKFIWMPLGSNNATQTFQRHMHRTFGHQDFVTINLDDLLISSSGIEEHLEHLRILSDNRLKCVFIKDKIDFLGFTVRAYGFESAKEKTLWDFKRYLRDVNHLKAHIPDGTQAYRCPYR